MKLTADGHLVESIGVPAVAVGIVFNPNTHGSSFIRIGSGHHHTDGSIITGVVLGNQASAVWTGSTLNGRDTQLHAQAVVGLVGAFLVRPIMRTVNVLPRIASWILGGVVAAFVHSIDHDTQITLLVITGSRAAGTIIGILNRELRLQTHTLASGVHDLIPLWGALGHFIAGTKTRRIDILIGIERLFGPVVMIGVGVTNTAVVAHRSTVIRSQSFEIHAGTGIKSRWEKAWIEEIRTGTNTQVVFNRHHV